MNQPSVGIGQDSSMPAMPRRRHINIPMYLLILPLPLCSSLFVLITIEYFDIPQPFILDPRYRLLRVINIPFFTYKRTFSIISPQSFDPARARKHRGEITY